ncbi:MAG: hypothetical protein ACFE98_07785 [Candidatus Hermodarchaeota archaeon]
MKQKPLCPMDRSIEKNQMKNLMRETEFEKNTQGFLSNIKAKGIFMKLKNISIPQKISTSMRIENSNPLTNKRYFRKKLFLTLNEVSGKKTKENLHFAIQWSSYSSFFALFLDMNHISAHDMTIFKKYNLIHGYIGSYLVLSMRQKSLSYYQSIIFFFQKVSSLIPSRKHSRLLFFRENKDSFHPTYFLFSSLKNQGLFVKALPKKEYIDNPNLELQIIQIGKIIGLNVPRHALLLFNNRSSIFQSFAKNSDLLIEPLTPACISFCAVTRNDIEELIRDDAENLGRMLVFDSVCGSWDRHCGNYLIVSYAHKKTLKEIDFGLFQPSFYKLSKSNLEDSERQKSPFRNPKYPGWAITRSKKVTYIMKRTNQVQLINGVTLAIKNLHNALIDSDLSLFISKKLFQRLNGLFKPNHPTYRLLIQELGDLGIESQFFIDLIEKITKQNLV